VFAGGSITEELAAHFLAPPGAAPARADRSEGGPRWKGRQGAGLCSATPLWPSLVDKVVQRWKPLNHWITMRRWRRQTVADAAGSTGRAPMQRLQPYWNGQPSSATPPKKFFFLGRSQSGDPAAIEPGLVCLRGLSRRQACALRWSTAWSVHKLANRLLFTCAPQHERARDAAGACGTPPANRSAEPFLGGPGKLSWMARAHPRLCPPPAYAALGVGHHPNPGGFPAPELAARWPISALIAVQRSGARLPRRRSGPR